MSARAEPTRRRVLGWGAGVGAGFLGGGVLAGCSDAPLPGLAPAPSPAAPPPTATAAPADYPGELRGVALCAAVSDLAAELCEGAVVAAGDGRVGQVPAVVTAFLAGAGAQHTEHAAAWNALLAAAGRPAVTGGDLVVETERRATLGRAAAPTDLLALAFELEVSVGGTVVTRAAEFTDEAATVLAATTAPVVAMHAATAAFLLGRSPATPPGAAGAPLGPEALRV